MRQKQRSSTAVLAARSVKWHVFYTAARAEKKCEARLRKQGVEVLLPKTVVMRRWKNGVRKKIEEPLFPNYLFARVDEQSRLRVLQTEGIVCSVRFDGKPACLTENEASQLQIAQQNPEHLRLLDDPLPAVGEYVEVREGPLRGLRGEVLRHGGACYVVICVTAVRQAVRVQVQADLVAPCPPGRLLHKQAEPPARATGS